MSERGTGKIIAIAVVFLAAIGGLAYWFFGVRAKDESRQKAQAEVLAWETRLAKARECLFGKVPASSDSGEAIAVRELTPDPWERKTCTKAVGGIARGVADDTGIMPVEHAWMTLDRAAAKVATAFAVSQDPYGKTAADERRGVSDLPDALRELDKAHAELRQAAKLPPAQNTAKVPALPVAQIVPFLLEGEEITSIDAEPRTSSGAFVTWGATKSTTVQITLVPGAAPRLERVAQQTVRSLTPGAVWAAAGLSGGVVASAIDAKSGAFQAPATIASTGGALLAAVGPLDNSFVAYSGVEGLVFAHGKGSPVAFTLDKPIATGQIAAAFDAGGRVMLAWQEFPKSTRATTEAPALTGAIISNGDPIRTVAIGGGEPRDACMSKSHGYLLTDTELLRFDANGATPMPVDRSFDLVGCGATGALLADAGTTRYTVCTDTCRLVDLRNARPAKAATLANDHVVSIGVRDRVLAVWSEVGAPAFYRLPEKLVPWRAVSDGKTIDVIAEAATEGKPAHYVVVRVPAI